MSKEPTEKEQDKADEMMKKYIQTFTGNGEYCFQFVNIPDCWALMKEFAVMYHENRTKNV